MSHINWYKTSTGPAVVVLSVIRFGFDPSFSTGFVPMLFSLPAMVFGLVFAWPGGIPLTRALEQLHPVSRPATYACAAVLCPLSVGHCHVKCSNLDLVISV